MNLVLLTLVLLSKKCCGFQSKRYYPLIPYYWFKMPSSLLLSCQYSSFVDLIVDMPFHFLTGSIKFQVKHIFGKENCIQPFVPRDSMVEYKNKITSR